MASDPTNQPSRLEIVDSFVMTSVATIIVIRTALAVFDYPKLGSDTFHIAHMLWGGLALTIALLISLLQRQANRELLALLGGVGFGFFIDEIGKFVTTDNNYFYDGSFLLMYVVILAIWLICRGLVTRSDKAAFFLPAIWPSRRVEQALVTLWAIIQLISLPFLAYSLHVPPLFGTLQLACIVAYAGALIMGLVRIVQRRATQAATTLRLAALMAIITVLPLLYYLNPIFALIDTISAAIVMIGLSEVSLKQLALRFLALR